MPRRYQDEEELIHRWTMWFANRPGDVWDLTDDEYLTAEECERSEEAWKRGEEPPSGPFVHNWWKRIKMDVRIKEQVVTLKDVIGEGGEARVYKLGGDMLAKVYRLPTDDELDPSQLSAARMRIVVAQKKLRLFPLDLPETLVSPRDLVKETTSGLIIGYTMPFIKGAKSLADFKSSAIRSATITDQHVMSVFRGLMGSVRAGHDRSITFGDLNDTNVLVRDGKAYIIDMDAAQFGPYRSKVFMPAFVDPNRCDPKLPRLELEKLHDFESDWYAWWVMLFQSLLFIHPYGGVHKPADKTKAVPAAVRGLPQHRISVYDSDVKYPAQARPLDDIPEVLANYFRMVFAAGLRPEPTDALFDALAFKADGSFDQSKTVTPVATVSGAGVQETVVQTSPKILAATHWDGRLALLDFAFGELRRNGEKVVSLKSSTGANFLIAGPQTVLATNDEAIVFSPGWKAPLKAQYKQGTLTPMITGTAAGAVFYDGKFKLLLGRTEPVIRVLDIDDEIEPLGLWSGGDLLLVLCSRRGKLGYVVHHVGWDQTINQQAHPFAVPADLADAGGYVNADGVWIILRQRHQAATLYALDARGHLLNQIPALPVAVNAFGSMCLAGKMLFCPTGKGITRFTPDGKITEFRAANSYEDCKLFVGDNIYAVNRGADHILRLAVA